MYEEFEVEQAMNVMRQAAQISGDKKMLDSIQELAQRRVLELENFIEIVPNLSAIPNSRSEIV